MVPLKIVFSQKCFSSLVTCLFCLVAEHYRAAQHSMCCHFGWARDNVAPATTTDRSSVLQAWPIRGSCISAHLILLFSYSSSRGYYCRFSGWQTTWKYPNFFYWKSQLPRCTGRENNYQTFMKNEDKDATHLLIFYSVYKI